MSSLSIISFNSYLESQVILEQIMSSESPFLKNLRILAVDDNDDCLCMITLIFEDCQAQIKTATSVDNAIQIIEEWKPDILISDIALPDKDGYSLIRFIRNKETFLGGFIPAVAFTSYVEQEYLDTAMDAGFQAVIGKPFDPDELVATVAKLAQRTIQTYQS
jgi:CheY-like chemotaxis protein